MLVEADQLVQNEDKNTVSAEGNVRIYYDGRTLEADKVVYNKTTKRLFATGHAKLTEKDGTIYHGDEFDLTDDFRDGFAESLRADTKDKTHFSAPRMERIDGDSVFDKGTYTACDACKDHPDRPPLWRVRAKKIIHKDEERTVYYEGAYLEFLGIPVAYTPFLSAPDPTVEKKSGVLSPHTFYKSQLGYGVGVPIFYNLAPDYDLTLTPTAFTQQGFFGAGEFRQRTANGMYYIQASGIDEAHPGAFTQGPYGAGNRSLRGDINTKGDFTINHYWKFGWNITALSDKYYLYDYSVPSSTISANYFSESISTIYLTGQGDRSFFDLRGFYIQGLSSARHPGAAADRASGARLQPHDRHRSGEDPRRRRPGRGRLQPDEPVGAVGGLPVGRAAHARLRLRPLRRLQHLPAGPHQRHVLPAARHRRRLHARHRPGHLPAQVHRHARRGVDAVRLRPRQCRDARTSTPPTPTASRSTATTRATPTPPS